MQWQSRKVPVLITHLALLSLILVWRCQRWEYRTLNLSLTAAEGEEGCGRVGGSSVAVYHSILYAVTLWQPISSMKLFVRFVCLLFMLESCGTRPFCE